jgi:hypothetical protein
MRWVTTGLAGLAARSLTTGGASRRLTASAGVPAKCRLRTYPLNLPGSCQRREWSMAKTAVLLCRPREPGVTVISPRRRVRVSP